MQRDNECQRHRQHTSTKPKATATTKTQETPTSRSEPRSDSTVEGSLETVLSFLRPKQGSHHKVMCLLCQRERVSRIQTGNIRNKISQPYTKATNPNNHPLLHIHSGKLWLTLKTANLTYANYPTFHHPYQAYNNFDSHHHPFQYHPRTPSPTPPPPPRKSTTPPPRSPMPPPPPTPPPPPRKPAPKRFAPQTKPLPCPPAKKQKANTHPVIPQKLSYEKSEQELKDAV